MWILDLQSELTPSCRDDIESLLYTLIYMMKGEALVERKRKQSEEEFKVKMDAHNAKMEANTAELIGKLDRTRDQHQSRQRLQVRHSGLVD